MPALLDVVDAAESVARSPQGSTLAALAALTSLIVGIAKGAQLVAEFRRKAAYAKIGPVDPMPLPAVDPQREAMLARIAQAERDTAEFRAMWKRQDAETKLAEAVQAMESLRNALTRERELNAELTRSRNDLRLECARLQLELDTSSQPIADDAVTLLDDVSERIPTIPPLRRLT